MKKNGLVKLVGMMVVTGLLAGGVVVDTCLASEKTEVASSAVAQKTADIFKGKIDGVSKKAKSISMTVGKADKAKKVMVKFDDNTKGMEYAKKGEAAIVAYEVRGNDKFATEIKPKLASLPEGVAEIQPQELKDLIFEGGKGSYLLVDSRPVNSFAAGHVPTSVSIPVELMKEKGAELMPPAKDAYIVFYCGGPT